MRVLICGSRHWKDWKLIEHVIGLLIRTYGDNLSIIHGGARGADSIAGRIAEDADIPVEVFPAQWNRYGRAAGPIRNQQMLDVAHPRLVVAFHDDLKQSKGTADMVRRAKKAGIPVLLNDSSYKTFEEYLQEFIELLGQQEN